MFEKDRKGERQANTYPIRELNTNEYPLSLGSSMFRPKQLFYKGTLPQEGSLGLAMVGTRRPGDSAQELCRRLVKSLVGTKAVIISGLAQGIDSYCHEAALEFGIPTIAVIAQGIEFPIPGARADLARRILQAGGAICSEYEGSTPSYKGMFPARNRIISGLSIATIVVESKIKGGALITAEYCLQEGKHLLAVPGDFDSEVSSGPNLYLDRGKAKPVFIPESLRQIAGFPIANNIEAKNSLTDLGKIGCALSPEAEALFKKFNGFRKTFAEIQSECNFKTSNILAILTELEIAGLVETRDNMQFYFNGSP